ncbi:uncharacterized protein LOC110037906, partial [Phalaenopsis equestris]|uniref:uncharacterized protein LOC110037906 n=1 Tax=Phalaenopsis equestris TaxID=78828 RepID=UPI0009E614D1
QAWKIEGVKEPWYVLWQLHKKVASRLRRWNFQDFGNVHLKVTEAQMMVDSLEHQVISNPSLENEVAKAHTSFLGAVSLEEQFLYQKQMTYPLPMRIVHASIKHRRNINTILKIKSQNGDMITDEEGIGNNAVKIFTDLLTFNTQVLHVNSTIFDEEREYVAGLSPVDVPSEQEIFLAFKDINPNKASRPDGFTSAFYVHCWRIIKKE